MRKTDKIIINLIRALIVTAAMVICMAAAEVSFAGTASGTYEPKDQAGYPVSIESTTYKLYHVGEYDGPVLKLLEQYSNVDAPLNFRKADFGEEDLSDEEAVQWREAWMRSADTLADYVQESDLVGTFTSSDGKFRFEGLANGLYLLTGTSTPVEQGNTTAYWSPRPMYIRILNDDPEYTLKPVVEYTTTFTVRKTWENMTPEAEMVKPDLVTIRIYYGGTAESDLVETVELNDANNWSYTWTSGKGQEDPSMWHVQEVLTDEDLKNFSVTNSQASNPADTIITITNKYDRYSLEIEKTMEDYISHQDDSSQAFVFEVMGYGGQELLLHKFVGLTFDLSADTAKTIVNNIPRNVDRIIVRETYSGNYTPDSTEKEAVLSVSDSDPKGIWKVSFTNSLPDTPDTYDTGVINKYSITGDGVFSFDKVIG